MQFRVSPKTLDNYSTEEWQARVELAAAHRLAYMHGFSEGIFNHLTLTVPGSSDRYYQIPFGTHWSEVTASTAWSRRYGPSWPNPVTETCDERRYG